MTVAANDDDVPQRLIDLRESSLFGLVSVDPDAPDGVIVYESCSRVGGRPAIEIPHEDAYLVDESKDDLPGGTTPPKTFEELLADYGCTAIHREGFTYVVPAIYDGDEE